MRKQETKKAVDYEKVAQLKRKLQLKEYDPGDILKLTREALGYNQYLFAEAIGVRAMTVSRWEKNGSSPMVTYDQCAALNNELAKIGLSVLDFPFLDVVVSVRDFKNLGLLQTILSN